MAPIALSDLSLSVTTPDGQTTSLSSAGASPVSAGTAGYRGYDHVHWYVGNAKQAAAFYVTRFGFREIAYRGLETGSRTVASHVVENGRVRFVLTSPIRGVDSTVSVYCQHGGPSWCFWNLSCAELFRVVLYIGHGR